jgi:hypothetical protein
MSEVMLRMYTIYPRTTDTDVEQTIRCLQPMGERIIRALAGGNINAGK